ncbi:vacuolar protein 8 [Phtheirospermum japonicum]|uniref:Vacuolar protein 8 n=1 Tax=Phtheirospermum japonicum TaxID=374723 RepID=A0A830BCN4_9LAMI|nr:vacuolar protein 8 [Phtheirospermum japonicum]
MGLLGLIKQARHVLVDAPVLIHLLKEGDPMMKLVAGNALGVMSSHVDHIRLVAQAGAVPLYADLLRGPDPTGKEIAEDVFYVLAVHEENVVMTFQHLVRILREGDAGVKVAAADVIWDLLNYEYSCLVVRSSGAVSILVELLKDESLDVREKVAGAVAQLSHDEADRAVLASCRALPCLIEMLEDGESDEVRGNAAEALVNFSLDQLLGDRLSCILDHPSFRNMRGRIMQMRACDEHIDVAANE